MKIYCDAYINHHIVFPKKIDLSIVYSNVVMNIKKYLKKKIQLKH